MPVLYPEMLRQWCGGRWEGSPPERVAGIGQDTRTLSAGKVYAALRGERFDGHDFISEAFEKGACAALVDEAYAVDFPPLGPLLRVPDSTKALLDLAQGWRSTWKAPVYGITGSVGKTTVRGMLAAVFSAAGKVQTTKGNWNNQIGLPLCMLNAEADAEFQVYEAGMNRPGEIARLAGVLRPDRVVMTTVGPAHLEAFESEEAIADEKADLLRTLPPTGWCVLAADEPWFELLSAAAPCRIVTVAVEAPADYRVVEAGAHRISVREKQGVFEYTMPLPGEHMIRNALRVIAAARETGLEPDRIAGALAGYQPPGLRWDIREVDGIRFINDAYNANPVSMRAAIRTFMDEPCEGRRWLVLGGMRELGRASDEEHQELGRFIAGCEPDGVLLIGEFSDAIAAGLSNGWKKTHRFFEKLSADQAASVLQQELRPGDQALLKASRGEQLETVLAALETAAGTGGGAK